MAHIVFNVAKGRVNELARLGAASDALIAVVLDQTGLVADATMRDYDTLADILAGASNEHTTMTRKTLASVTVSVDDTGDQQIADCDNITWTTPAAGSGSTGKLVICYDDATGSGTDANLIPLVAIDFVVTPDDNNIVAEVDAAGFFGAS